MNRDFIDLLRELSDARARCLIVGAYPVSFHSEPRATGHLDIWVEATAANAARLHHALARFGAPLQDLSVEDLTSPDLMFQMGVSPRRIDILTSITGVGSEDAWRARVEANLEGVCVAVLGRDALIANKRALGRPKDLVDLEMLERYGRDR